MKISMRWLSRYIDLSGITAEQVHDDLTMSTAEVEGIEVFGGELDDVVIGHVVEREKHPDADKLSVTKVDVGDGELRQIVCGAPNVAADQKVAVIQPGKKLPGNFKIKKTKIRGLESLGMICSESELGLSDESDGILVLDENAQIGKRFVDHVDVLDHVLEIDNKSINHRPDLWGHYGIARELGAMYGRKPKKIDRPVKIPTDGPSLDIVIDDAAACPRYLGVVIRDVKIQPSPDWMRYLLSAVGQRSIDLSVDLTNFVMLELGQPMHAFDLRKLDDSGIRVRFAKSGETMNTLDGQERKLQDSDLLITSGDRPVALAGVMGGEDSAVAEDTTDLFLESANFHPATIRRTSTRLGLRTDSSARFEKSLDPANAELAAHRFLTLLGELCPGARAAGPIVDPAEWRYEPKRVGLRRERLDLKLGHEIDDPKVTEILESLEFDVQRDGADFDVGVPSFRATKDVSIEDDLIEEVGRMFRYDNIPEQPLVSAIVPPPREPELYLVRQMLRVGASDLGTHEVYNYSFIPDAIVEACGDGESPHTIVTNPVAPENAKMRRHVAPSLLASLVLNLEQHADDEIRLMEDGRGYHPETRDRDGLPHEVREVAFAWTRRSGAHPYAELRSAVETLLERVAFPATMTESFGTTMSWMHPGKTVRIDRGEHPIGCVGAVHPQVAQRLKLPLTTAVATLDIRAMLRTERRDLRYDPISPYPPQPVDVALLVETSTQVGTIAEFLRTCGKKLVRSVELFEVYTGEGVPNGKKSLNFTVTLGAMDRTLSAKDEEKFLGRVRDGASEVGAELRDAGS